MARPLQRSAAPSETRPRGVNSRFISTYFDTAETRDWKRPDIFDPAVTALLDSARACNSTPKQQPRSNIMGYMGSWNANHIDELEEQEAPSAEQIEALQLTEEERAELNAE
ncbi:hypothetical protein K4754_01380 [Pseudomonas glycinae]|uniref:hypothetical protein n=1 Tax=Pseudomonas glycinae TaxID=1785145 RepID=UPI001C89D2AC|nr:hypothetical protein [Pseudomonas glycinae]MBX8620664.1 hypothetical protein [Pseudomonas glycinae]